MKTTAVCFNGNVLKRQECYGHLELTLGKAQRANKKRQVKVIHAKIKNRRKDTLHIFTTKIAKEDSFIVVGNVSSQKLAKSKRAKFVLDARELS